MEFMENFAIYAMFHITLTKTAVNITADVPLIQHKCRRVNLMCFHLDNIICREFASAIHCIHSLFNASLTILKQMFLCESALRFSDVSRCYP